MHFAEIMHFAEMVYVVKNHGSLSWKMVHFAEKVHCTEIMHCAEMIAPVCLQNFPCALSLAAAHLVWVLWNAVAVHCKLQLCALFAFAVHLTAV